MKTTKHMLIVLLCSTFYGAVAQQDNVLWEKTFWETKPTLEIIKQKVKEGHSPTALTPFGFDAVTSSIFAQANMSIVKYLLSFNDNHANKLTHDGRTYIFWAAYKGNLELVKYLIKKGAKTNLKDDKGYTVLTFTAVGGQQNPALYDFLIANGANVLSEKSKDGANALLLLIPKLSNFKMISYFESKGLDLNSKDNYGNGAFNYTASTGNVDMLKKLVEKGLDYKTPNAKGGNAFIFASRGTRGKTNGLNVYNYLESLGINPNVTTKEGVNPLHNIAFDVKDPEIFNYFIKKGVDVNQKDKAGNTPLINAAGYNNLNVVKLLASQSKNVNTVNNRGQSALTKAVSNNNAQMVEFLIAQNANTQIVDSNGNNLAHYLVNAYSEKNQTDFKEKQELLKAHNILFTAKQAAGNTLYHNAIDKLDLELLKQLKPYNIDINAVNNAGLTVLHLAAMKSKDDAILKYLIDQGARKDILTDFNETVYDLASENELLKANNINLNFLK